MVTVRAPATSANLGSGFDVFGISLDRPADVIRVERAETTSIEMTGAGSDYIPEDPAKNVAGAVADSLGVAAHIRIDKGVRPSSGLGSSAASAAGVAVALAELYELDHTRRDLIEHAAEGEALVSGEAHIDNVAPALLGGFTIATEQNVTQIDSNVPFVVCLPELVVSTRDARQVVPDSGSLDDVVDTVGRAATLTAGMFRGDPRLVGLGMTDRIVTPARTALIDGYDTVSDRAIEAGATGVTVSGAGPAIIATGPRNRGRAIGSAMIDGFGEHDVAARVYQTEIGRGVVRLDG